MSAKALKEGLQKKQREKEREEKRHREKESGEGLRFFLLKMGREIRFVCVYMCVRVCVSHTEIKEHHPYENT